MKTPSRETDQSASVAETVALRLEQMILQGVIAPGEKLASERDLAEKLEVSRPSVKLALGQLEKRGLLESGRAGTRVARFLSPLTNPLAGLFQDKPRVTADYFEYRRQIEAMAARLAASRATDIDRKAIREIITHMKAANKSGDLAREAQADVDLHLAIYEASHNLVLLHIMRVFSTLLRDGVFFNRDHIYREADAHAAMLAQHIELANAVLEGDGARAERAAAEHMRFTFETVEAVRRDGERLKTSLLRLERDDFVSTRSGARKRSVR